MEKVASLLRGVAMLRNQKHVYIDVWNMVGVLNVYTHCQAIKGLEHAEKGASAVVWCPLEIESQESVSHSVIQISVK